MFALAYRQAAQRRIIAFYLNDYNTSFNYFENKF